MVRDIDKKKLLHILRDYVKKINYPLSYEDDYRLYNRNSNFNCYAYAIGLKVPDNFGYLIEEELSIYNPGTISGYSNILYNEKNLIKSFMDDCDILGIKYTPTYIDSDMEENSSKIGIYISEDKNVLYRDFHFAR